VEPEAGRPGTAASEEDLSKSLAAQLRGLPSAKVKERESDDDTPAAMFGGRLEDCIAPGRDPNDLEAAGKLKSFLKEGTISFAALDRDGIKLIMAAASKEGFTGAFCEALAVELASVSARTVAFVAVCPVTFQSPPHGLVKKLKRKFPASKFKKLRDAFLRELGVGRDEAGAALHAVSAALKGDIERWRKGLTKADAGYEWEEGCRDAVQGLIQFNVRDAVEGIFQELAARLLASAIVAGANPDLQQQAETAIRRMGADRIVVLAACGVNEETQTYPANANPDSRLTRGRFTSTLGDKFAGQAEATQKEIADFLSSPAVKALLANAKPVAWCLEGMGSIQQNRFLGGGTDPVVFEARDEIGGVLHCARASA
jgi:hypothetical protein